VRTNLEEAAETLGGFLFYGESDRPTLTKAALEIPQRAGQTPLLAPFWWIARDEVPRKPPVEATRPTRYFLFSRFASIGWRRMLIGAASVTASAWESNGSTSADREVENFALRGRELVARRCERRSHREHGFVVLPRRDA